MAVQCQPFRALGGPRPLLLLGVAHALRLVSYATGKHMSLTPFSVRMCMIHRHFDIGKVCRELGYRTPRAGLTDTKSWFRAGAIVLKLASNHHSRHPF